MIIEKLCKCPTCNKDLIGYLIEECYIIECKKCRKQKLYSSKKEAFINPKKGFYD